MTKAEWRNKDWSRSEFPEREHDYETCLELATPDGVIARVEQFAANPGCFYANTAGQRSGCLGSLDYAKQWCEVKTGNRPN